MLNLSLGDVMFVSIKNYIKYFLLQLLQLSFYQDNQLLVSMLFARHFFDCEVTLSLCNINKVYDCFVK